MVMCRVAATTGAAGSAMFRKTTLPSPRPLARVRPSGENATAFTPLG
jgi:hypothetical protein